MNRPASGYQPISSNTGFIFASQTLGSVLRAIYAAVLARQLGPELFGLMSYGLGWYAAFLAVANLQLESWMSREIALQPARAEQLLSRAMTLRVFSTTAVFAIAAAAAFTPVFHSDAYDALPAVLLIYAIAMAGRSAAMWCNSAFISRENTRQVFVVEVAFRSAEILVGITALLLGAGLLTIALIHALSWWGQSLVGYMLVHRHLAAVRFHARLHEQLALLRAVLPVAVSSIAATWLMQGPFVLFKDKAAVAADLGVVALVLQIHVLLTGLPVALGRAALPALTRTVARTDRKEAVFLSLVLRAAIPATAALVICAATAAEWLVTLVFGEAYRAAGTHLPWALLLVLPFGVATIANQVLIAHDRARQAMTAALFGAIAMSVAVALFMPVGGSIPRYLLCVFAGMLAWMCTSLLLLAGHVAIDWWRCLARPVVAAAVCMGLYHLLAGTIGACGSLVVALPALLAGQWALGIFEREERDALWRQVRTFFGRGSAR